MKAALHPAPIIKGPTQRGKQNHPHPATLMFLHGVSATSGWPRTRKPPPIGQRPVHGREAAWPNARSDASNKPSRFCFIPPPCLTHCCRLNTPRSKPRWRPLGEKHSDSRSLLSSLPTSYGGLFFVCFQCSAY